MEEWKNIDGFPGYQVSNTGKVRSYTNNRHGADFDQEPRELKAVSTKRGYESVQLGRANRRSVHRLVAEAFIPNINNDPMVRHLDDNPHNNCVDNLAWGTQTDNMRDCVQHGRLVGNIRPAIESTKKKVLARPKTGGKWIEFESVHAASRELGVWPQHICSVIQGKISQTGGWIFKYTEEGCDE